MNPTAQPVHFGSVFQVRLKDGVKVTDEMKNFNPGNKTQRAGVARLAVDLAMKAQEHHHQSPAILGFYGDGSEGNYPVHYMAHVSASTQRALISCKDSDDVLVTGWIKELMDQQPDTFEPDINFADASIMDDDALKKASTQLLREIRHSLDALSDSLKKLKPGS